MALDEADKKHIADLIAAAFKPEALGPVLAPAIEAHVKAATKGAVTEENLKAALAEFAKTVKPADEGKSDDKGDKGKGKADGDDPALSAMRRQMDELKASAEADRRARIDAERKAVVDANKQKLREALVAAGIDPKAVPAAAAVVEATGSVTFDGESIGWKGKDTYGADKVFDYAEGAKTWAKSDDGKRFLPATGAGGTGEGGGNRGSDGRNGGPSKIRNADGTINLQKLASAIPPV